MLAVGLQNTGIGAGGAQPLESRLCIPAFFAVGVGIWTCVSISGYGNTSLVPAAKRVRDLRVNRKANLLGSARDQESSGGKPKSYFVH
jgi:hypothetical protein